LEALTIERVAEPAPAFACNQKAQKQQFKVTHDRQHFFSFF
jgi:hypothetical protein